MGADQRFDLIPDLRIAFDFSVGFHEDAGVPGVIRAVVGTRRVAEPIIPEDLRVVCVRGAN